MKYQLNMKGLEIFIKIDNDVPEQIMSDMKRFKQILFNLVGNASKFTFEG